MPALRYMSTHAYGNLPRFHGRMNYFGLVPWFAISPDQTHLVTHRVKRVQD